MRVQALEAVHRDGFAFLQAGGDDGQARGGGAEGDAALLGLLLRIDDVDEAALGIGQDGGAGDGQRLDRLDAFEGDGDEGAIEQVAVPGLAGAGAGADGVGDGGAQGEAVGVGGDGGGGVVQLAGLGVEPAIGQADADAQGREAAAVGVAVAQFERLADRDGEGDVHRVLADDGDQGAGGGGDDVAGGERGAADAA